MWNYRWQTNEHIRTYIEDVESGFYETCIELKLSIKLVKERLNEKNVIIKHDKIQEAIDYMGKYFFDLLPWEKYVTALCVGCYEEVDGYERLIWNEYFLMLGRGNGKNGFISALTNYFQTSKHGIRNYGIDIVATSEEQAKTSFEDIYEMLKLDKNKKVAKKFYNITKKQIVFKKTNSYVKYRTSNAKTKDGLRSACVIFDEIHAYETTATLDVFTSGLGKIKDKRIFYITTDGKVRDGVLDTFKLEAEMILKGEIKNSRMLPIIYKMDSEKEVSLDAPHLFEKANPSIRYMHDLRETVYDDLKKSYTRPQMKIETFTKRFNLPKQDMRTVVASWKKIKATETEDIDESFEGAECIGGFDFASVKDFASAILIFKKGKQIFLKHHTWICSKGLEGTRFTFDIEEAVKQGYAEIVECESLDAELMAQWFADQAKKYAINTICIDNYRAKFVREEFKKYGLPITEMRNGTYTHTQIHPIVEKLFADELIKWGGDFMMRWYTNNVYVKCDKKDNKTYEKIDAETRKTDGFMAFIHAMTKLEDLSEVNTSEFTEMKVHVY